MEIICPQSSCRASNHVTATSCSRCGTLLQNYIHLSLYPAQLFNQGLEAAQQGNPNRARDLFAAVVQWCPQDIEARKAFAMACIATKDVETAHEQYQRISEQLPDDTHTQHTLKELRKILIRHRAKRSKRT